MTSEISPDLEVEIEAAFWEFDSASKTFSKRDAFKEQARVLCRRVMRSETAHVVAAVRELAATVGESVELIRAIAQENAAKDMTIETQKAFIEHLQRLAGAA